MSDFQPQRDRIRAIFTGAQRPVLHDALAEFERIVRLDQRERDAAIAEKLYPPDADVLRKAEGDQRDLDRYWIGWVDALDILIRAIRASEIDG